MKKIYIISVLMFLAMTTGKAEDRLELETTIIKGNKELPQILYVVPWKDIKRSKKKEQQIVIYSLFGDLFDPLYPGQVKHKITADKVSQAKQ